MILDPIPKFKNGNRYFIGNDVLPGHVTRRTNNSPRRVILPKHRYKFSQEARRVYRLDYIDVFCGWLHCPVPHTLHRTAIIYLACTWSLILNNGSRTCHTVSSAEDAHYVHKLAFLLPLSSWLCRFHFHLA